MKTLLKSEVRLKSFCPFLTSIGCPASAPTKAYEDNKAAVSSVASHCITPRLRHIDIPLCYLHDEQAKGAFEVIKTPSRMQMANMGAKPETGPSMLRNASLCMGHAHLKNLPDDQYALLCEPAPVSCYKYFRRENTPT